MTKKDKNNDFQKLKKDFCKKEKLLLDYDAKLDKRIKRYKEMSDAKKKLETAETEKLVCKGLLNNLRGDFFFVQFEHQLDEMIEQGKSITDIKKFFVVQIMLFFGDSTASYYIDRVYNLVKKYDNLIKGTTIGIEEYLLSVTDTTSEKYQDIIKSLSSSESPEEIEKFHNTYDSIHEYFTLRNSLGANHQYAFKQAFKVESTKCVEEEAYISLSLLRVIAKVCK